MRKWLVLLRGINVSGQKKIIMSELRELLTNSGYQQVITYIQSGNILLLTKEQTSKEALTSAIRNILADHYGFAVEVFAMQPDWLEAVAAKNPFLKNIGIDQKQLYITFLEQPPAKENIARLGDFDIRDDAYFIDDKVIYIRYRNGAGRAKLTNNLIEAKLEVKATSRNWSTTLKLIELSK